MSVVVIDPPSPIVTLDVAKAHLRVDNDADDALIDVYLAAAQGMIDGPDGILGRCIGEQTLELRIDGFVQPIWGWGHDTGGLFWGPGQYDYSYADAGWSPGRIELPFPPLISVTSVKYEDQAGVLQDLASAAYLATDEGLDAAFGTSFPNGRWEANAVRVRYVAGYIDPPPAIVAAILLMVGDLYQFRETAIGGERAASAEVHMSTTVENLLRPYRVYK